MGPRVRAVFDSILCVGLMANRKTYLDAGDAKFIAGECELLGLERRASDKSGG
jgi:hypothetical protein